MIESDFRLSKTVQTIYTTMSDCKSKMKNGAMLRNLTDLAPITHNETKWTSKFAVIQRFNKIGDKIIQVPEDKNANVRINSSEAFKGQAESYKAMLKYFNIATTEPQKKFSKLHDCRCIVQALLDIVEKERRNISSLLSDCKFNPKRVA